MEDHQLSSVFKYKSAHSLMLNETDEKTEQLSHTCILLAWVLMGNTRGYGLSKLQHLGWQETYCRTAKEYTEENLLRILKTIFSFLRVKNKQKTQT